MGNLSSWKIASIRGVSLEVHVSLLLLLPYLVFLTVVRYQAIAMNAGVDVATLTWGPVAWGFILAVGLFASIAIHEFGHVFVAQSQGVRVRNVTLMMLGGVSNMEKMPDRPYSEFKLAVIGPIVSFALAGIFLFINSQTRSPDMIFFTHWLGSVNLMLAIFNLLPAFPLDGGRALRSVLAAKQGLLRGTQTSVRISKVFAWALGALGLLSFNFLLMLIAFFIYSAAQSELFFLLTRGVLRGMKAGEIYIEMDPISDRMPLRQAVDQMLSARKTVLPVVTATGAPFIIGLERIRRVPRHYWDSTLVRDVMQPVTRVLSMQEPVGEAIGDLAAAPQQALPVKDHGIIVGLVRFSDINEILQFRSLAEDVPDLSERLRKDGDSIHDRPKDPTGRAA